MDPQIRDRRELVGTRLFLAFSADSENGKMGHFRKNEYKKWGISRKKHVIDFKTGKIPKLNMFDFGAFQEKLHMSSRAKYLLFILVGAFQETPRS